MQHSIPSNGYRLVSGVIIVLSLFAWMLAPPGSTAAWALTGETAHVQMIPASFSDLAELVSPAVVNIRTEKIVKGRGGGRQFKRGPFDQEDPMQDFFDRFFGPEHPRNFKQRSLGSGFIIDKQGYIVTNNHVVEQADNIKVIFNDEKEFDAEVVGRDPNTDLALIKIQSDGDFHLAELGDSDSLKVGQWVVAIGNPFGLGHTVTAGIVSAKGRVIGSGPYDDYIQTDASINPGNSGGPLINMQGQVVGINTVIVAGGQGIGFAIPINLAKGIVGQLKESGEVTRGWLGVAIQDINKELAEYYNLQAGKGALVTEVFSGDPADKAGIKTKDIIVEVDGIPIASSRDLTGTIAAIRVGKKVRIKVLRDGREKTVTAIIARRDEEKLATKVSPEAKQEELGVRVAELTPEMAQRLNVGETQGVVVVNVKPGSQGEKAGLQSGDIIKEINRTPVKNVAEYRASLDKVATGETIRMFVRRPQRGFLVVKITK